MKTIVGSVKVIHRKTKASVTTFESPVKMINWSVKMIHGLVSTTEDYVKTIKEPMLTI